MELIVNILRPVLLVVLVIDMIALVIVVLLQSDKSGGLGVLGGSSSQTGFGNRKADPIVRVTQVLGTIFLVGSFALAFLTSYSSARINQEEDFRETEENQQEEIDPKTDGGKTGDSNEPDNDEVNNTQENNETKSDDEESETNENKETNQETDDKNENTEVDSIPNNDSNPTENNNE